VKNIIFLVEFQLFSHKKHLKEKALFSIWVDITDGELFLLLKYLAFLEKGWGLGKGKTSFLVKRSFSLPQEPSTLIGNSAFKTKSVMR
jgi:hypothetical protein